MRIKVSRGTFKIIFNCSASQDTGAGAGGGGGGAGQLPDQYFIKNLLLLKLNTKRY